MRIPAHDLEEGVWCRLKRFLTSPTELLNALGDVEGRQAQVIQAAAKVVETWQGQTATFRREWLKGFLLKVVVSPTSLILQVNIEALRSMVGMLPDSSPAEPITLEEDTRFKRNGRGLRFVIPGANGDGRDAQVDKPLLQAVARGRYWL